MWQTRHDNLFKNDIRYLKNLSNSPEVFVGVLIPFLPYLVYILHLLWPNTTSFFVCLFYCPFFKFIWNSTEQFWTLNLVFRSRSQKSFFILSKALSQWIPTLNSCTNVTYDIGVYPGQIKYLKESDARDIASKYQYICLLKWHYNVR